MRKEFGHLDNKLARQIKGADGRVKTPQELDPAVLKMLRQTFYTAETGAASSQVEGFTKAYGSLARHCDVMPEKKFQAFCAALAKGMQFTIDKWGKEAHLDEVSFTVMEALPQDRILQCSTSTKIDERNKRHYASDIQLSRSQLLSHANMENAGILFGSGHTMAVDLNLMELGCVLGIEEMDHAVRAQKLCRTATAAGQAQATDQELKEMEAGARSMVLKGVEAYQLGNSRRGQNK